MGKAQLLQRPFLPPGGDINPALQQQKPALQEGMGLTCHVFMLLVYLMCVIQLLAGSLVQLVCCTLLSCEHCKHLGSAALESAFLVFILFILLFRLLLP